MPPTTTTTTTTTDGGGYTSLSISSMPANPSLSLSKKLGGAPPVPVFDDELRHGPVLEAAVRHVAADGERDLLLAKLLRSDLRGGGGGGQGRREEGHIVGEKGLHWVQTHPHAHVR